MKINRLLVCFFIFCSAVIVLGQGTWDLIQPEVSPNRLVSLDFIDAQNGLAVGLRGTILKTTDGGESWRTIALPWRADLTDVDFVTPEVAYIIGESSVILKSKDGGESWTRQPTAFTNTFNRIRFYDTQQGWIIGDRGLILHTVNGGQNWNLTRTGFEIEWFGLDFNSQNSWTLVGSDSTILRTTDAGSTWHRPEITGPDEFDEVYFTPRDVFFLNEDVGWLAGAYRRESGRVRTYSALCKTTDGGANWAITVIDTVVQCPNSYEHGADFYGLHGGIQQINFIDENQGVCLSGPSQLDNAPKYASNVLFHTTDGGKTWISRMETLGVTDGCKGRFCFLTGQRVIGTHPFGGFVVSNDGGAFWQSDDYWKKSARTIIIGNNGTLTSFDIKNNVTLPIYSPVESYLIGYQSQDFGKSWQSYQPQKESSDGETNDLSYMLNHLCHLPKQDVVWGFEFSNDSTATIYETLDYGLNWSFLKNTRFNGALDGMYVNGDTLIQFGFTREFSATSRRFIFTAMMSSDGGQSAETYQFPSLWNEITMTCHYGSCYYENQLSGYYCFNGKKWIAVGSDGNIILTADGGKSWQNIPSGVTDHLQDIYFVNAQTGFIAGNFGRILKTEDGGLTWRKTNSGTQDNVYCIIFENEMTGWAGTSKGLSYTIDGGETWAPVSEQGLNGMVGYLEYDNAGNLYGYSHPTWEGERLVYNYDEALPNGIMCVKKAGISSLSADNHQKLITFSLYPNYPNPFNSNTVIKYDLKQSGEIELAIYNIQGKQVRQLESGYQPAGCHTVRWDGLDQQGQSVSSGVYLIRLISEGHQQSHKMLYLR